MSELAVPTLARFAAGLRYEDLPDEVVRQARNCIIDTVGVAVYGSRLPWSRIIAAYALRNGAGGACSLFGNPQARVHAPFAALANGAFSHAFEQDSLRRPGAAVHPGASLLPAALAAAETSQASGRRLLTAFVAGLEVMFRIGAASRHSSEALGFHGPGLTGPYGAAIASGLVQGLDADQLAAALGIAGSLSGGLLAFTKADQGAMVKRLHLGRAAESGILASQLAGDGFEGPHNVLEGRYGFLEAYCRDADPSRLTAGLGQDWETLRICIKAYPCHITAHTPIQALRRLMTEHQFTAADVTALSISGAHKLISHHDLREPQDLMQAQYSVPFCVALALVRDPADPRSWDDAALADPLIRSLCRMITLQPFAEGEKLDSGWHTRIAVDLLDGRRLTAEGLSFRGMPEDPLSDEEIAAKFRLLIGNADRAKAELLLAGLQQLEAAEDVKIFSAAASL